MKNLFLASVLALGLSCAFAARPAARPACLTECTPRIGIVSAFGQEADILVAQTRSPHTWVINGNRFTTGVLRGNPVVIVLSGVSMINSTMSGGRGHARRRARDQAGIGALRPEGDQDLRRRA